MWSRSEERRVGKECRLRGGAVQAEDGIRDGRVTGVQTCALPIYVIRVFQVSASASGTYLAGPDLGCDVEFWAETKHDSPAEHNGEPIAAGSLLAPRRNRWADVVKIGRASCRERV